LLLSQNTLFLLLLLFLLRRRRRRSENAKINTTTKNGLNFVKHRGAQYQRQDTDEGDLGFSEKVLPEPASSSPKNLALKASSSLPLRSVIGTQTDAASEETVAKPSNSAVYETPKPSFRCEEISGDDDDDDNESVEEDAWAFGGKNDGPTGSPYILLYLYNRRYLDSQNCIRKDGD